MNPLYSIYRQFTNLVFLLGFPVLKVYSNVSGRYTQSLDQRLGFYSPEIVKLRPDGRRIWLHAASVGEVNVAAVIAEELQRLSPESSVFLSTTTETGYGIARERVPAVPLVYAPVDATFAVKKALSCIKPEMLVCIETEIWPNLIVEAHRTGIKTVMANGRISVRSCRRYEKILPFFREILKHMDFFSMIHEEDAERICRIGAPRDRVFVNGNAKYDGLIRNHLRVNLDGIRRIYSLTGDETVIVAGSTRKNEESVVFDAYEKIRRKIPEALLFIAPRHIDRASSIYDLAVERGFDPQLRSGFNGHHARRTANITIMDTIGELAAVYGVSSVAFCGGSLVPLGGQNLLEAAVWGKPVFYGPYMEDFQEAKDLVEAAVGDAFLVRSGEELAEKIVFYLMNETKRRDLGRKAKKAVLDHQGAARRHAEGILHLLESDRGE
ncbi:MAG: 3-deoxy-D-manno-octulosonic acid transferase [Desulfobacterales bacterium]